MVELYYNDPKEQEWTHHLRINELEKVLEHIHSKKLKILEIGGGDGFIAKCFEEKGYDITSIDPNPRFPQSFPVKQEDGTKMSFSDQSFDIVITFHVLQSVEQIQEFFSEISRILKNDGMMIHVVPSSFWVMITSFWHTILLPRNLIQIINKKSGTQTKQIEKNAKKSNSRVMKFLKYVFLHPVGVKKSAFHELVYFRKKSWTKLFLDNNMKIKNITNGPEIYSGHSLFKNKILNSRKKFVKGPITSSYCFALTKGKETK